MPRSPSRRWCARWRRASRRSRRRPGAARSGPAATATGFPDSVPAWYTGPAGASSRMVSARPPNAAAGSPPLITLPKVNRSASTGSRPYQPAAETRNPVITSSITSSAPCRDVISRSPALNPGSGAIAPMFPAAASVMTQAMSVAELGEARVDGVQVVVGQHDRLRRLRPGDARGVRQAEGDDAGAGRGEQGVDVPVVAARRTSPRGAGRWRRGRAGSPTSSPRCRS